MKLIRDIPIPSVLVEARQGKAGQGLFLFYHSRFDSDGNAADTLVGALNMEEKHKNLLVRIDLSTTDTKTETATELPRYIYIYKCALPVFK